MTESANGVATPVSSELISENGPHTHYTHTPSLLNCGGSREPCSEDGSIGETENSMVDGRRDCDGKGSSDSETDKERHTHTTLLHTAYALDPSRPVGTCTGDTDSSTSAEYTAAPLEGSPPLDSPVSAYPQQTPAASGIKEMAGEKEKQDEEEDEKEDREEHRAENTEIEPTPHSLPSATPDPSSASGNPPPPPAQASDSSPCPPHVMAQVRVRNVSERERIVRGMQDSKSLDEISQACGGNVGARGGARGGQPEGRRATISSALELEGTVSQDGDLTVFICKNLEQKIKMSSKPSLDCSDSDCSGPIVRGRSSSRRPADIPPIDPDVILDLQRHTQEVAHSVEMMMRSLNGTIQNMTALSVGYIQTYRDSVDSLGESVDMSIKGMYTLMARCEELDRSMQPIHSLAAQIRDIKRTLDALEAICK